MARCEQGYLCIVCGQEVDGITQSGLYLRYVLGEIPGEQLLNHPERHIHCDPELAQYIVDIDFAPVLCTGLFAKQSLDPTHVALEEQRVTQAWRRLQQIPTLGILLEEYPLE